MPVSPILPGRLPGTLLAERLRGHIQRDQAAIARLRDMAATGQRFFRPGEAPAAAARTVFLQKEVERNVQLVQNVKTDRSLLAATETALQSVADAMNRTKAFAVAGAGTTASPTEKRAMAQEVAALVRSVVDVANTTFRGRSLFGGTETAGPPFELLPGGRVLYRGDAGGIESQIDAGFLLANNVDGATAFAALTTPISADVNPALTLDTRLADLHGGAGVPLGPVRVTVDDGGPVTATVDLTGAETVRDVKTRLEAAFGAGPPGLTVSIDAADNGLLLTPTGGTVEVADVAGGFTAYRLGIASGAAATIDGGDLNPVVTPQTRLADLNGGAGIDLASGLRITSGDRTATIDLSAAVTVEDALNAIRSQAGAAGIELAVGVSEDGNGLAISSRISGEPFAIGENGGLTATGLGVRTLTGSTRLADLDRGLGVPVGEHDLEITRRDGTTVAVNLSAAKTVQDVIAAINAVDPGVLVASLNATGNGITLLDDDGVSAGPLAVASNPVSRALGLAGTEAGADRTVPLVGSEPNPQEAEGIINLMVRLQRALETGDDVDLARLGPEIDAELARFAEVRGDVAARLQTLDSVESRLLDREVALRETLRDEFEVDIAEVLTEVTYRQATLEATLRISAQTMSLSLINYL